MSRKTIITIGTGTQYEAVANAIITPGQVVELLSTGKVQKKATEATLGEKAVAIEDYLQGKGIADTYAAGAMVMYRIFKSGDESLLILADGENVAIGDKLVFDTLGEVRAAGTSTELLKVCVAMEALDASASAGVALADRRIVVRWL
jgi:hypothetical protein